MDRLTRALAAAASGIVLSSAGLTAQVLHTNDRWEECAFVIAPVLTQQAWRQFASEIGLVMYFRPLASAKPLGAKHVEIAIVQWSTRIDDATSAWNDTFSHPDSTHWLFDGDALPLPALMLRVGITDRIDVGTFFTQNVKANYGVVGGQVQYSLLNGASGRFDAAGRVSGGVLFGPDDLNATVLGADLVVSRDVAFLSPYAGVSGYLSRAQETTSKVNLEDESSIGARGTLGVVLSIRKLKVGAEYNVTKVTGYSFKVAFGGGHGRRAH
jgi:hypothetical protein